MIEMNVREGILGQGDCRGNFRWEDRHELFEDFENREIDKSLKSVRNQKNLTDPLRYMIEGPDSQKIPVDVYVQRGCETTPLLRVRFKSKTGEPYFDSRPYMRQHFKIGDTLSLKKTGPRTLKVVGRR